MKTALLIPLYNQSKYWLQMMAAIEKQSELPDVVYILMDRPLEEDFEYVKDQCKSKKLKNKYIVLQFHNIPEYIGRPTNFPGESLFLTGDRRNQGIDIAIKEGCDKFIFIDGDCIPEHDLVKSHKKAISKKIPVLVAGRRREEKYGWLDQREVDPKMKAANLFKNKEGIIIYNSELVTSCSVVWSCNISFNLHTVKLIKKLNSKFYGRSEVFNSEFVGSWGAEDSFFGVQCVLCKVFILMLSDEYSGIRHIDHPRPLNKYGDTSFASELAIQIHNLNDMQALVPLTLDFFNDEFIDSSEL